MDIKDESKSNFLKLETNSRRVKSPLCMNVDAGFASIKYFSGSKQLILGHLTLSYIQWKLVLNNS